MFDFLKGKEFLKFMKDGDTFAEYGRYDDAVQSYNKAIQVDPTNIEPWFKVGLLHKEKGRCEEAIQAFDKVLEMDPKYVQAVYQKGFYGSRNMMSVYRK
jgi:tetratricopeptide (TPR) repeat protein